MVTKEKLRRFDVYYPSVHVRKWIGSSNILVNAITIGERFGCRAFDCLCCKYEIYDNKIKTSDIQAMIKNVVES